MTDGWSDLTASEQTLADQVFTALAVADDLMRPRSEPSPMRLTAGQVHAWALNPELELDDEARVALRNHPRLAELLDGLIRRNPVRMFPRAAAAADGPTLDRRLADGFRIRLVPSRSTRGQTYVIIDLPLGLAQPAVAMFMVRPDAVPWKFRLPPPMHGQVQLLAESESDLVVGLADPETEIFLR